jgi:hypothetical protein
MSYKFRAMSVVLATESILAPLRKGFLSPCSSPVGSTQTKKKNMKQLSRFIALVILSSAVVVFSGCASTGGAAANSARTKQRLLAQAGFQLKNVITQKQQQRLAQLPADKVSPVKYHGRTRYVYPMAASNQAYIGNKAQYQSYLDLLRKEQAQASAAAQPQPVFTEEVPGPGAEPILIQEYDDWGPLLTTE